eukprot:2271498-Rhodomonas_salina.1
MMRHVASLGSHEARKGLGVLHAHTSVRRNRGIPAQQKTMNPNTARCLDSQHSLVTVWIHNTVWIHTSSQPAWMACWR